MTKSNKRGEDNLIDSIAFYVSILRRQFTAYCTEKLSEMDITQGQIFIIIYIGKRKINWIVLLRTTEGSLKQHEKSK